MLTCFLKLFTTMALLVVGIECSSGDYDPNFRKCFISCFNDRQCEKNEDYMDGNKGNFVHWNCDEKCSYFCMTSITAIRKSNSLPTLKYFGHWPFERYFGLEEPASVLFSFLNFIPHIVFFSSSFTISKPFVICTDYMRPWLQIYAFSACNAWTASTLFHCHKTQSATLYDYMSALAFLTCGLCVCLRRLLGPVSSVVTVSSVIAPVVTLCCYRLIAMWYGSVTFDSHMYACIALVVVTTALWGLWTLLSGDTSRASRRHRLVCLSCQAWLVLASALEVFDFPPYWRIFDAHSLWHAATVPLGFVWYWWFWRYDREEMGKVE